MKEIIRRWFLTDKSQTNKTIQIYHYCDRHYETTVACTIEYFLSLDTVFRFDTSASPLIFADQFIKFSTRLSSPLLYGLGEHEQPLLLNVTDAWKRLTFWTRDVGPSQNNNLYG